jgi:rubrerythrin
MVQVYLNVPFWRCERCGYTWLSRRSEAPVVCARCKNPYWKFPKKSKLVAD